MLLTLVAAVLILFWQTAAEWSDLGIDLRRATVRFAMWRDRLCGRRAGGVRIAMVDHRNGCRININF